MKNVLISTLLALALAGCGTTGVTLTPPQIVKVGVPIKCTPTQQITPITVDPMDGATKENMSLFEKNQRALAEADLIKGQNKELTAALAECTKEPDPSVTVPIPAAATTKP